MANGDGNRVLLTGMSGTGKSTLVHALAALGYRAVDLDSPGWSEYAEPDPRWPHAPASREWVWRTDRVRQLLEPAPTGWLFVSGCASNQGEFYAFFDHIVLLTAPVPVTVARLATRTSNPYGKRAGEVAEVLANKQAVEPLLRQGATLEIDTSAYPIRQVVQMVLHHAGLPTPRSSPPGSL